MRAGAGRSALRLAPAFGRAGVLRPPHHRHLQRQRHDQVQAGIDEAGAAPADVIDHESAERPADRAGEAAEQREVGDRSARRAAIHTPERGEDRVIEAGAHADAEQRPGREIKRQRRRQPDAGKPGRVTERARQQHGPAAVTVDQAADLWRDQPGDQEAERGAPHHDTERPAGVAHDRLGEHGREIERRAPGEDLGRPQRGDDHAAIKRRGLCLRRHRRTPLAGRRARAPAPARSCMAQPLAAATFKHGLVSPDSPAIYTIGRSCGLSVVNVASPRSNQPKQPQNEPKN